MLKKKEYFRRLKKLLSESPLFDPFKIQQTMQDAHMYRKDGLSPAEAAEELIEIADLLKDDDGSFALSYIVAAVYDGSLKLKAPGHSPANTQDTER